MVIKMKFLVDNLTKCVPRLGLLKDFDRHPSYTIETPMAMLYTRGGSLPHITHEVFKIICKTPQIIQIPIVSTYHYQEIMEEFNGNISEFVGLKDCLTCVTVQDPSDLTQPGHHYKDHIPLWTRSGKIMLNAEQYMNAIEAFQPDMYYFLSDGDTNAKSATKRVNKAVDNTIGFVKHCLDRHKKSSVLANSFAMAAITGGYCTKARKKCIEGIPVDELHGFLIDGLHNNGPEVEFIPFDEPKPIVEFVVNNLPGDKLRVMQGCWNPMVILKLVQLGIDVFDTSYCNIVTERSSALIFCFDIENYTQDHPYEINLRQTQFADDFKPLIENCTCLACSKHTKAYIHHLVTVQELLGPLLLTIHNNHHFLKFFEKIRKSIKDGTIKQLEEIVEQQFMNHQRNMMKPNQEEAQLAEN